MERRAILRAAYRAQFLAVAAIDETATVLDVGCGSVRLATAGSALGVDLSSRMIALARRRAEHEQVANVTFQQADAQVHPFPGQSFDIAISRHGAMFFGDPVAAFTNIAQAHRPDGRSPHRAGRALRLGSLAHPRPTKLTKCRETVVDRHSLFPSVSAGRPVSEGCRETTSTS
jgi:ubiquinone/menaquinone biosynthesis C-methylase UbiE